MSQNFRQPIQRALTRQISQRVVRRLVTGFSIYDAYWHPIRQIDAMLRAEIAAERKLTTSGSPN